MIEREATIRNEAGIHCRPSAAIVKEAMTYSGTITVTHSSGSCDLKSIMGLLGLGLGPGETVVISVTGPGEKDYADKMQKMFETHFDFPPRIDDQTTQSLISEADGASE